MTRTDKLLCIVYGVIASGALIATWSENLQFFMMPDNGGFIGFIRQTMANHAAASFAYDLIFFCLAAFTFMIVEARRWKVRFVWLYLVLSFAIAVSVMFPLFMIARQMRMVSQRRA